MANIIELDDDTPVPGTPPIKTVPPQYRGSTHDIRFQSLASIITHVAGRQLFVDYYQQIKGLDDINQGLAPNELSIYQQYKLIKQMEIRVTSPFSSSQDDESMEMVVTADATMYPTGVIPDRGDMLVFATGDGEYCLCEITSSTRVEFFKETTYKISYQLKEFLNKIQFDGLKSKVVEEYVFDRNFLTMGRNPVIQTNDFDILRRLEQFIAEAGQLYFAQFFSHEYHTLVVPSQGTPVYDPFLMAAIPYLFDTSSSPEFKFIRPLNIDGDINLKTKTIWDVLLNVDKHLLPFICTEFYLVNTRLFERDPYYASLYHSGMRRVVYPKDPRTNYTHLVNPPSKIPMMDTLTHAPSKINQLGRSTMPPPDYDQLLGLDMPRYYQEGIEGTWDYDGDGQNDDPHQYDFDQLNHTKDMPEYYYGGTGGDLPDDSDEIEDFVITPVVIHPYMRDHYYLFSEHFYNQSELLSAKQMSGLEKMVSRMLNKQSVGIDDLMEAVEQFRGWDALEKFYYVPVLVLLAKYTLHTY